MIRLGGGVKMPCYWIMYADEQGNKKSFGAYYYKNVPFSANQTPVETGDWTQDHFTLGQLLQWAFTGALNA